MVCCKPVALGATRLADLFNSAANMVRRRSTVFVVSDFISEPGWEKPLGLLTQKHGVVAVRLFDPLEAELPDLGLITLRDATRNHHAGDGCLRQYAGY